MKAFYTLLNFSKGPVFFGADKSSFYTALLKGTAVKLLEKPLLPAPARLLGFRETHTHVQSQPRGPLLPPASPSLSEDGQANSTSGPGQEWVSDGPSPCPCPLCKDRD